MADGVVVGSALVEILGRGGVAARGASWASFRAGLDLAPAVA